MDRHTVRASVIVAVLLAVVMAGFTAGPVSAGTTRFTVTERFALKLVNCMRTGGRVTRSGDCIGWGSGKYSAYRGPLERSQKISDAISWPWAQRTATTNICGHSLAGSTVDTRFRAAGFKSSQNGESIGCGASWTPRQMAITIALWWQAEKSYGGSHWRQLKDKDFQVAGIAVAKLDNGRTRLVVNFYGPPIP